MHDSLASLLSESLLKVLAVVLGEVVSRDGLSTILVDSLEDLVTGGVTQTGEQREELASNSGAGLVLEDDLVQLAGVGDLRYCSAIRSSRNSPRGRSYLGLVAHQSLRNGVDLLNMSVHVVCRNWNGKDSRGGRRPAQRYQRILHGDVGQHLQFSRKLDSTNSIPEPRTRAKPDSLSPPRAAGGDILNGGGD